MLWKLPDAAWAKIVVRLKSELDISVGLKKMKR